MTIEYLSQIRETEELAEKIKHEGQLEAKRIIRAANEKAAELINLARQEADKHYKEITVKAEAEAQEGYESIIAHAEWECQMLLNEAKETLDEAVTIIIDKVVYEWQS